MVSIRQRIKNLFQRKSTTTQTSVPAKSQPSVTIVDIGTKDNAIVGGVKVTGAGGLYTTGGGGGTPTFSSAETGQTFADFGSAVESVGSVGEAKAQEIGIQSKVSEFQKKQQTFYQNKIEQKLSSISNFNSLARDKQQAIIDRELGTAQKQFDASVQAFQTDLENREIARREQVPFFKKQADELKKGVIFLKPSEVTSGGTSQLSLPTSFVEQDLMKNIDLTKSFFGDKEAQISYVAGSSASPLTTSESFHLQVARLIGSDTSHILTLRELGALPQNQKRFQPFGKIGKALGIGKSPSIAQLLIITERVENLKGIPSLLLHPSQLKNVPSAILEDIKDYGKLAVTSPDLFRAKLGADVGIYFVSAGLLKGVKATGVALKTTIIGEKLETLKFIGYEALKSPTLSITLAEFEKGGLRGYAVGLTRLTGEETSTSFVFGQAGKLDLLKTTKLPASLLEQTTFLETKNRITFTAVQKNLARDVLEINLKELSQISPHIKLLLPFEETQLSRQISLGVLKQAVGKERLTTSFFSKGFSSNAIKNLADIEGISKDLLTGKKISFIGRLKRVPFESVTKTPQEAYFTFTKLPKTPLAKTFADISKADISVTDIKATSQALETKSNLLKETNMQNLAGAISHLKTPSTPKLNLPKFPIPRLKLETRGTQRQSFTNRVKELAKVTMAELLAPTQKISQRNRSSLISKTDVTQTQKFKQESVVLQKTQQAQQSKLALRTKLLLKTPTFTGKGFSPRLPLNIRTKIPLPRFKMREGKRAEKKLTSKTTAGSLTKTATFTARELNALRIKI